MSKSRFLPTEETPLYFTIHMKNIRLSGVTALPVIDVLLCCLLLTGKYMLLFVYRETKKKLIEAFSPERAQEIIHSFAFA